MSIWLFIEIISPVIGMSSHRLEYFSTRFIVHTRLGASGFDLQVFMQGKTGRRGMVHMRFSVADYALQFFIVCCSPIYFLLDLGGRVLTTISLRSSVLSCS